MDNEQLSPLGRFTRPIRADLGMSLGEMARKMGVSSAAVSSVELHTKPFPMAWIDKISSALDLDKSQQQQLRGIFNLQLVDKMSIEERELEVLVKEIVSNKHALSYSSIQKLKDCLRDLIQSSSVETEVRNA